MTRVLITGAHGMLGTALGRISAPAGIQLIPAGREGLDITNPVTVDREIATHQPDAVINTAAYTAVDQAEREPELAALANGKGPAFLALVCRDRGIPLIHLSTDYVFDGMARRPYLPGDDTGPMSVYGRTKLEGEQAVRESGVVHLVIRTAWVYSGHGRNFLRSILRQAGSEEELRVVADQTGSPTAAADLAEAVMAATAALLQRPDLAGTYHFTNAGETTWHGFAQAIIDRVANRPGIVTQRVLPITTADYPVPARRPAYSVLDCGSFTRAFQITPRTWTAALDRVLLEAVA